MTEFLFEELNEKCSETLHELVEMGEQHELEEDGAIMSAAIAMLTTAVATIKIIHTETGAPTASLDTVIQKVHEMWNAVDTSEESGKNQVQ